MIFRRNFFNTTDNAMLDRSNIRPSEPSPTDWRQYQHQLQRPAFWRRHLKSGLAIFSLLLLLPFAYGIMGGAAQRAKADPSGLIASLKPETRTPGHTPGALDKKAVQDILDRKSFINLDEKIFGIAHQGRSLKVETSLDLALQKYILRKMNRSNARYIGILVMDPSTGKVLSMVSFDKSDPQQNPVVDKQFPAASIFKIVTAAAAVEKCGFEPETAFVYNGRKYTLYKSQLKDRVNRYSNHTSFKDAFAESINPVFGKIGAHYLESSDLSAFADAFGFNRPIDFEISVDPSVVRLSDDPYRCAEIASGFNRETTITPLHAALISSAVVNQGRLVEPTIVNRIVDESGRVLYQSRVSTMHQVMTPKASGVVNALMEETIRSGTAHKAFRGYRRDRVLSQLNIGGKTGSIDNTAHDARFDWFVGYAEAKDGQEKIVLSILVAHEKYIGVRASRYARMVIKQYFRDYFNRQASQRKIERPS